MSRIVEFPHVVGQAVQDFGDIFQNEPQRRHFGEYVTGLIVARKKTVLSMNGDFVHTTDQSCLNRFLTEASWDEKKLNEARLTWLQEETSTAYSKDGVLPLDNTLVDHSGKLIEDVGWFWDHAEDRHKIAHDLIILNYVCESGKHYPLEFRRFRKEEACQEAKEPFKKHTELAIELIDWACEKGIPGHFVWDSYFSSKEILNYAEARGRSYVADLKSNRKIRVAGREVKASVYATQITPEERTLVRFDGRQQWYFSECVKLPGVGHRVRIVFLWKEKNASEASKILATNMRHWEIKRILSVYGKRWTGTETFHRDAKQHLGLGECQLRDGKGHTRHMYLVMLAYSLLMVQMRSARAREWALHRLTTIGQACRATLDETLGTTLDWVVKMVKEKEWDSERIKTVLSLS